MSPEQFEELKKHVTACKEEITTCMMIYFIALVVIVNILSRLN